MCDTIVTDFLPLSNISAPNRPSFADVIASARRAGLPVSHLITQDVAIVPSATSAAVHTEPYILVKVAGDWACNCPAEGRCWHQRRAEELEIAARGQADTPNPPVTNPPPAPAPDTDHRYIAALRDELYGDWAA